MRSLVLLAGISLTAWSSAPGTWLVVVSGVGGDAAHREAFVAAALSVIDAAQQRFGVAPERTRYLAERIDLAPDRIDGPSRREQIEAVVDEVATEAAAGDQVLLLLIGHGSAQGGRARFNIPGPDLGPAEFATMLSKLSRQRVAFVDTTSSSGAFLAPLSAPGRTVVTATRSGRQQQEPRFLQYFVEAFTGDGADTDKDEGLSILEMFQFAPAEVQRAYSADGLLRTEHALLDDTGDGEGSTDPTAAGGDGETARRFVIGGLPAAGSRESTQDPELARWLRQRQELADRLEQLRARKGSLEEQEYLRQLEDLLVRIAEIDARIRERGGTR